MGEKRIFNDQPKTTGKNLLGANGGLGTACPTGEIRGSGVPTAPFPQTAGLELGKEDLRSVEVRGRRPPRNNGEIQGRV